MTLHEYAELVEYWTDHPPSHLIDAARIGHRPRERRPPPSAPAGIAGLLQMAPGGVCRVEDLRGGR